jgi:hypothetical protein
VGSPEELRELLLAEKRLGFVEQRGLVYYMIDINGY